MGIEVAGETERVFSECLERRVSDSMVRVRCLWGGD
jgi:hypothetical protein